MHAVRSSSSHLSACAGGGSAVVYEAEDVRNGGRVALKVFIEARFFCNELPDSDACCNPCPPGGGQQMPKMRFHRTLLHHPGHERQPGAEGDHAPCSDARGRNCPARMYVWMHVSAASHIFGDADHAVGSRCTSAEQVEYGSTVQHPNIVRLLDVFADGSQLVIVVRPSHCTKLAVL